MSYKNASSPPPKSMMWWPNATETFHLIASYVPLGLAIASQLQLSYAIHHITKIMESKLQQPFTVHLPQIENLNQLLQDFIQSPKMQQPFVVQIPAPSIHSNPSFPNIAPNLPQLSIPMPQSSSVIPTPPPPPLRGSNMPPPPPPPPPPQQASNASANSTDVMSEKPRDFVEELKMRFRQPAQPRDLSKYKHL